MKTMIRVVGRPWKSHAVGSEVEVNGPKARLLVGMNRAELVDGAPSRQTQRMADGMAKQAAKKTARKAAAKKTTARAPAKKATKTVRGENRSMRGKTTTK